VVSDGRDGDRFAHVDRARRRWLGDHGDNVYRGDTAGSRPPLVGLGLVTTLRRTTVLSGSTYYYVVTAVNAIE